MELLEIPDYTKFFKSCCICAILFGFADLSKCPATPPIPVYLIVGGILGLTLPVDANWNKLGNFLLRMAFAITGFFWIHFGGDFNHEDPQALNFCPSGLLSAARSFNKISLICLFYFLILYVIRFVLLFRSYRRWRRQNERAGCSSLFYYLSDFFSGKQSNWNPQYPHLDACEELALFYQSEKSVETKIPPAHEKTTSD